MSCIAGIALRAESCVRILVNPTQLLPYMSDKSQIPQFSGAHYTGWAFKVKYGLTYKTLHRVVMNWDSLLRRRRPVVILPLTADEELQFTARGVDVDVERRTREQRISQQVPQLETWDEENLAAMAYIVKHLGPSELTHVMDCTTGAGMWEALKSFYMVQGAIEIANTEALLSAIIQTEAEDLNVYVKRPSSYTRI